MKILNNKKYFYQWDMNMKITSDSFKVGDEIHFSSAAFSNAVVVRAFEKDGKIVANVPNIFLQSSGLLTVYRYVFEKESAYTKSQCVFEVKKRPKPDDYIYTETEVLTWKALDERMLALEQSVTEEAIGKTVEAYIAKNPVGQVQADWNQTDETAVDYVKNRTHYTEVVLGASTTYIARYYTGNDTMGDKNMSTALVYAFDNVKLTFENEAVLQSNVLTGETRTLVFAIGAGTLTMVATANDGNIKVTNNTGISQRVVWEYPSSVEVVVHQIDEKFIPETIARTADIVATPPAATVGQTIVVKSVDNTGKPTAWEAVDMAESVEIPETLPNPNKLTFTGAVTAEYDGSEAVSVEIPVGGGSVGGSSEWELLGEVTSDGNGDVTGISIPFDGSKYKEIFAVAYDCPSNTKLRIILRTILAWYNGKFFGYNGIGTQETAGGKMNNKWVMTGYAYDIGGRLYTYGGAEAQSNGGHALWRQGEQSGTLPATGLSEVKYISVDTNSSTDIVPEGVTLLAYGRK